LAAEREQNIAELISRLRSHRGMRFVNYLSKNKLF